MTRPKGSLNKIKKPPKQPVVRVKTHETLNDLKKVAKENGVKLKSNISFKEVRELLGYEPMDYPKRYDHCKERKNPMVVIKTNMETGEEVKYDSILKLARAVGKFAGSITYRIKTGKKLVVDGVEYSITKDQSDRPKGGGAKRKAEV